MVRPARDETDNFLVPKNRGHERDVRKMRSAVVGVIQNHDVFGIPILYSRKGGGNGKGHGPKMNRDVSAWATSSPFSSKTAEEQSLRSLMLGEKAVRTRAADISSATPFRA